MLAADRATIRPMTTLIAEIDKRVIPRLRRWGVPALRLSLSVVFVWFGALKILGVSPVVDLVASTVYWVDPSWFVPVLGVVEVLVGVGLALNRGLRLVLAVVVLQLAGTFLVFVLLPDVVYQDGNPLALTVEGEFVVKNLVLLAAAIVVGSRVGDRESISDRVHAG